MNEIYLTQREADTICQLLVQIRINANNPNRRRYQLENMCSRAIAIIKNAKRRNTKKN